jgi:hypothetical protein
MDKFVHMVCPGDNGDFQPIGRRVPATRARPPSTDGISSLATVGSGAASMTAALRTNSRAPINAQVLAASDLAAVPTIRRPTVAWALNDVVIDQLALGVQRPRHLPVIEGDSPLWPDHVDSNSYWYAPEFGLLVPSAVAQPNASPFAFTFRTVGHDTQGKPGMEATVRLTVRRQMPADVKTAWEARLKPNLDPVWLEGLSASLEIPFRDEQGRGQVQAVTAASVNQDGDNVIASFQLTDQWARLCYGALALPAFQEKPARIAVSYMFAAYVPVNDRDTRIDWGGKETLARPAAFQLHGALHAPIAPTVTLLQAQPKAYGIKSQGRTSRMDVSLPCSQFGALYTQTTDAGDTAIGCRDALTLGQIEFRLYEQIEVDLGDAGSHLRVYRSLQVPGRFLVVPEMYSIARFEPGDSRAYRPAIYMFSSIDAVHPERSSCIIMATLQPAVPMFRRRHLLEVLRQKFHPDPTLEWPTELSSTPVIDWVIGDSGASGQIRAAAAKVPDGFQVSLSAPIESALQLKSIIERAGVNAGAQFPLSDGTSLQTTLSVDLTKIEGPWSVGPVEAARSGGSVTLTNRVEQAIDLSELVLYGGSRQGSVVPVERRLGPGETFVVAQVPPADEIVARCAAAGGPSSLEEVRTFIEDIFTNVVFMTSIDFTAQGITDIAVEARVVGVEGTVVAHLSAAATTIELRFVLPLTVYLAQPTLQFHASGTRADGSVMAGAWRDWRLDTLGNIVSITSDSLQGG